MLRLSYPVLSTIDVHQQDATIERDTEGHPHRGGLEGYCVCEYGRVYKIPLQDGKKVLRRGGRGDAGGG